MKLEELQAELKELHARLKRAKELSPDGVWSGDCGILGRDKADGVPWIHLASCYTVDGGPNGEDVAQAIAIRHNTAGDVLAYLGLMPKMIADVERATDNTDHAMANTERAITAAEALRKRAETAEGRLEGIGPMLAGAVRLGAERTTERDALQAEVDRLNHWIGARM